MSSIGDTFNLPGQHVYAVDPFDFVPDTLSEKLDSQGRLMNRPYNLLIPALVIGGAIYMYSS